MKHDKYNAFALQYMSPMGGRMRDVAHTDVHALLQQSASSPDHHAKPTAISLHLDAASNEPDSAVPATIRGVRSKVIGIPRSFVGSQPKETHQMNGYPIKTALAVAVAGFLGATGAMAQTSTTSPSTAYPSTMSPSTVSPSTQSDMKADEKSAPIGTPSKTDSMSKSSQGKMAMPNHSETSAAAWAKLDANHRGYLMPEDVSQLKDFDFQAADKNHDGRIDATEFKDGWTSYGSRMNQK